MSHRIPTVQECDARKVQSKKQKPDTKKLLHLYYLMATLSFSVNSFAFCVRSLIPIFLQ